MKKILFAAVTAFTVHIPASAVGSFVTGNSFVSHPEARQVGYVVGVMDTIETLKVGQLICLPKGGTAGQATAVVKKYLNEHPEELHLTASSLIIFSLMAAFPCN